MACITGSDEVDGHEERKIMRINAVLVCGFVLTSVLAATAQLNQASQSDQAQAVVHDGKSLDEWVKALSDDEPETRLKAARALVAIGEPAFPAISNALSDSYQPVWQNTVDSLVKIGEPSVPALLAAIRLESSGDLRHNGGVAALQQMGAAAHPALGIALNDKDPDVRMSAAVALRLQMICRDQEAVIKLLGDVLQTNKDVRVRMIAAESLGISGMMGPPSRAAVDALIPALKDSEPDVQGMAAVGLARLRVKHQDVIPVLIQALKSKEEEGMLPYFAAESLGQLGPAAEPAIPALIEMVRENQPFIAGVAAEALGKIGPAAVPALRELLKSSTGEVQAYATRALGSAGASDEQTISQLLKSLKQADPEVRAAAVQALGRARAASDEVIAALIKALADDEFVQSAAIRALGRIGSKARQAAPALTKLLGELEYFERDAVMNALGSIGPGAKEAIPALEAVLLQGRMNAATTLARIGPASVPTLIKALRSEVPEVREAAAWGVRCLGQDASEAVPELIKLLKTDERACNFSLQALGAIGPDAEPAVPAVVVVLRKGDSRLRSWALDVLSKIGPSARGAKDAILEALETDDQEQRWEAARALLAIGEVDAGLPVVLKQLKRDAQYRWIDVIELLIAAGSKAKSAVPSLAEMMLDEKSDAYLRIQCAKALIIIAPDDGRGIAFLKKWTGEPRNSYSLPAALTLVELNKIDAAVIPRLKAGLDSKYPLEVIACAGALAREESERDTAVRLLRNKLHEKDSEVCVSAAIALTDACIVDPVAVKILADELWKDDCNSGIEMVQALAKIMRESPEARAVVEESQYAERDMIRDAARAAIKGDQK